MDSPIFLKSHNFVVWILERSERFRKTQRFTMGLRIQNCALDFRECLIDAVKGKNSLNHLYKADVHLEKLRHNIRICVDLKLFSLKQYSYAAENLTEIGKLLGGWIKSARTGCRSVKQAARGESEQQTPCFAGRFVEQQSRELPFGKPQQEQS